MFLILAFVVSRPFEIIRTRRSAATQARRVNVTLWLKYGIVSSANFRIQRISARPRTLSLSLSHSLSLSLSLHAFINTISMDEPKCLIQRSWIFQRCWRVYVNRRDATILSHRWPDSFFNAAPSAASPDRYVIANGIERERRGRSVSRRVAVCVNNRSTAK